MKKLSFTIITCVVLTFNFLEAKSYSTDPKSFVTELVNDVIIKVADKTISVEDKITFIENIALENVDINALGMYTLGELRKSLNKDELAKYQNTFEKYFLKSLTSRLTEYSNDKFKVIGDEIKSSNYTMVKSIIEKSENKPEIKIDWRIYTKNLNKPLIRDLIVEGLSLARTQKEEFASILNSNNNDINILIEKLENFVNE